MFWNFLLSYKIKFFGRYQDVNQKSGFGLIELLVSISIMAIVTSIIMTRQSAFNSAVLLRSQAYEIAFQVREIQLNAVSAKGDAGNFRSILGLQFSKSTATSLPNNSHYYIFRDTPAPSADANGMYDSGEDYGLQGLLDSRFEIRDIRAFGAAAVPISGNELSVIFVRPNFDARFFDSSGEITTASRVEIDVARRGVTGTGVGVVRTLEITKTGQIAVQ